MHNSFLHYIIGHGAQCCTTDGLAEAYLIPPKTMIVFGVNFMRRYIIETGNEIRISKVAFFFKKIQVTLSTSLRSPMTTKLDWRFYNEKYAFRECCLRCESIFGLVCCGYIVILSDISAI